MTTLEREPLPTREVLYGRIERKVDIVKGLWHTAAYLPAPPPRSQEASKKEERLLSAHLQHALELLPEAAQKYQRFKSLVTPEDEILLKEERGYLQAESARGLVRGERLEEANRMLDDEDLRFLVSLEWGIQYALHKRDEIRTLRRKLGWKSESANSYSDFLPEKLAVFKGKIRRVIFSPFSVNLVVDGKTYMEESEESWAFHKTGTIFNVFNEDKFKTGDIFDRIAPQFIPKLWLISPERLDTFYHEEFHSLWEGFVPDIQLTSHIARLWIKDIYALGLLGKVANGTPLEPNVTVYLSQLGFTPSLYPPAKAKELMRAIFNKFQQLYYYDDYEELLAAYHAAYRMRKREAQVGSYINRARRLSQWIQEAVSEIRENDPTFNQNPYIDRLLQMVDLEQINQFMEQEGKKVRRLAETASQKVEDCFIALMLFPPSQWRHIDRLVDRWTLQATSGK